MTSTNDLPRNHNGTCDEGWEFGAKAPRAANYTSGG